MVAPAADVESHSFPVFNATTTESLWVATNTSIIMPAALLFGPGQSFPEGFLLLPKRVDVWRAGAGGFPTLNNPLGLRGSNDSTTGAVPNATDGLAAVEIGTVRSYAPESPNVGLNVTITPSGTAAPGRRAVWVEYNAVAHLLRVYVAAGGEPRPARALLDARLSLAGQGTTQTAFVGFFATRVRDVFLGVRDWDLTVDRLDTDGKKKGTPWWVILIAVLGSVAATAAIVSLVVCSSVSRRRARDMEPKQ
ncbi:hypothetical protein ZWY2020_003130 [Hordeum vulgare]|nr:hypothetical protein ZWY2020_003130 [Hordeum vulgare]